MGDLTIGGFEMPCDGGGDTDSCHGKTSGRSEGCVLPGDALGAYVNTQNTHRQRAQPRPIVGSNAIDIVSTYDGAVAATHHLTG
jgi:hypothetical protein